MFRGDGKEMSSEDQESIALSKESIKKSDVIMQQVREAKSGAEDALRELQEKIAALKKEKEEQAKASTSASGLFSHDQSKANDQPQDAPKNKKGKGSGGCNIS